MGKRELLIAVVFVVLGFGVYRFTAPPADTSKEGFSVGRMVEEIKREIHGRPAHAETTFAVGRPIPDTVKEINLDFKIGAVTIIGEDRTDIDAEMHVRSNGYDAAEAEKLAGASHLEFDEAGEVLTITAIFPVEGRQYPKLRLRVPARLALRVHEKGSDFEASNVASVSIGSGRGITKIRDVTGSVHVTQRGGNEVTIANVGSLKLEAIGGVEAHVSRVRGDAIFSFQSGELRAEELGGALEVESRNTEMQFDKLEGLKRVRINAAQGEVVLNGLKAEARIDGRRTEIRVDHAGGAPLAIYNDGDEPIELTVPPAGFTMDAVATEGEISVDEPLQALGLTLDIRQAGDVERAGARDEARLTGKVRGGGPPITLRAKGGDIVVRGR